MKYIKGLAVLGFFLILGVISKRFINLPIPDTIYGMVYLLLALKFGLIKTSDIENVSNWLLDNLGLFLVPLGAEIITSYKEIDGKVLVLVFSIFISMLVTMVVTGRLVQYIQERRIGDDI